MIDRFYISQWSGGKPVQGYYGYEWQAGKPLIFKGLVVIVYAKLVAHFLKQDVLTGDFQ